MYFNKIINTFFRKILEVNLLVFFVCFDNVFFNRTPPPKKKTTHKKTALYWLPCFLQNYTIYEYSLTLYTNCVLFGALHLRLPIPNLGWQKLGLWHLQSKGLCPCLYIITHVSSLSFRCWCRLNLIIEASSIQYVPLHAIQVTRSCLTCLIIVCLFLCLFPSYWL